MNHRRTFLYLRGSNSRHSDRSTPALYSMIDPAIEYRIFAPSQDQLRIRSSGWQIRPNPQERSHCYHTLESILWIDADNWGERPLDVYCFRKSRK